MRLSQWVTIPAAPAPRKGEICDKFSMGTCPKLDGCKYQHKCAACGAKHPVKDCKAASAPGILAAIKSSADRRKKNGKTATRP